MIYDLDKTIEQLLKDEMPAVKSGQRLLSARSGASPSASRARSAARSSARSARPG